MKKKYLIIVGVVALLVVTTIGGTLAAEYVESDNKLEAPISEKSLSVAIVDAENNKVEKDSTLGTGIVPGGEIKLDRSVTNPEADGYDIYARVNVYYNWENVSSDNSQMDEAVFKLLLDKKELFVNTSYEKPTVNGDWLIVESVPGQITMYYKKPIECGETVRFLDGIKFETNMDNAYAGASLELTYEVDAVQAGNKNVEVAKKAIAAEWGVFATIEDGCITAISETRAVTE